MTTREEVDKLKVVQLCLGCLPNAGPIEEKVLTRAKSLLREVIEDLEGE